MVVTPPKVLIAVAIVPIERRSAARLDARKHTQTLIEDLERAGITLYKMALLCHRQFNTVKNWKATGRMEHYDGELLRALHSEYCKDLTISTTREPK